MRILVTGAKGFVGKNLCAQLNNIKDGKARNYGIAVDAVYEYDLDSTPEQLDEWCCGHGRWDSVNTNLTNKTNRMQPWKVRFSEHESNE